MDHLDQLAQLELVVAKAHQDLKEKRESEEIRANPYA